MGVKLSPKNIDVVILCGGRGSRLGPLTREIPKPLLKVGNQSFLVHLLNQFYKEGFRRFILAAHYLSEQFEDFIKEYQTLFPSSDLKVVIEKEPLGTGGALQNAARHVSSENFVALNGDVFVTQPMAPVLDYHFERKNVFTMVAVKTEKVDGLVKNKGGLEIGEGDELLSFRGHSQVNEEWINGGFYVVNRNKILSWPSKRYDLENMLASLLEPDKARIFRSGGKLLDIGTPECLEFAQKNYETYSLPSC